MTTQEGLRKPPILDCMKRSIVFHCIVEVIVMGIKQHTQLRELHFVKEKKKVDYWERTQGVAQQEEPSTELAE